MHRFDEDDHEPVAVVRTLSDFALALTLVVLMLIGTRSAAENKRMADTHALTPRSGATNAELNLLLINGGKFKVLSEVREKGEASAAGLAGPWISAHPNDSATIVLQFPTRTLATELHRALLDLQSAFGTNLDRIDTTPQL
jgi:hypothetical protein